MTPMEMAKLNLVLYLQTPHPELLNQVLTEVQARGIADAIEILVREVIADDTDSKS